MFSSYRIMLVPALLCCASIWSTENQTVHFNGKTFRVQQFQLKTKELVPLLAKSGNRNKIKAAAPLCPPPPPINSPIPPFTEPAQNPNAPSVAFFPNNSVANSTQMPPQTVGAQAFVSSANNPGAINMPVNIGIVIGADQPMFTSTTGMLSYDRNLMRDNQLDSDLLSFFNTDGDQSFFNGTQEIQMRFDKFENRLFFGADLFITLGNHSNAGIIFGVSDRPVIDEHTTWTVVSVMNANLVPDASGCPGDQTPDGTLYDYTRVGVDKNAYYICSNIFDNAPSGGLFVSCTAFVINKQSIIKGGPAQITVFRDVVGYPPIENNWRDASSTLIPVLNLDDKAKYGYFITQDPFFFGRLVLYRVLNPCSAHPTLSAAIPIDVPTTYSNLTPTTVVPFLGNMYGSLGAIAPLDDRLKMAHIRNKQLFTVHNVLMDQNGISNANGDRWGVRWYQIDLTGDSSGKGCNEETATTVPALVQAGTLFDTSATDPISYFNPAIMTNKRGDLSIAGMLAGNTQSISAFNVGKLGSDPKDGTLRIGATPAARIIAQGSGPLNSGLGDLFGTEHFTQIFGQRVSDWIYTAYDPVDDLTMWNASQYIKDGLLVSVISRLDAPVI